MSPSPHSSYTLIQNMHKSLHSQSVVQWNQDTGIVAAGLLSHHPVNRIGSKNANVGCVSRLHTEMAQSGAKIHSPSFNLAVALPHVVCLRVRPPAKAPAVT
jgi:hypothetical protein